MLCVCVGVKWFLGAFSVLSEWWGSHSKQLVCRLQLLVDE